jgi:hypothetical protein
MLAFFTPWVSVPLGFFGVLVALSYLLLIVTTYAWVCVPLALAAAILLGIWMRPRYRLEILDSSPLGVFYWFQRRS